MDPSYIPDWESPKEAEPADPALISHDMATIKHTMWYYAGLVRSQRRLDRALRDLANLRHDIDAFYRVNRIDTAIIELRNAALAAIIVARAAWENRESAGCHYRTD